MAKQETPQDTVKCHYCEQDRPIHQTATYPHGIFCSNNHLNPTEPPCWKAASINGTKTLRDAKQPNKKSALLAALGAKSPQSSPLERGSPTGVAHVLPDPAPEPVIDKRAAFLARLQAK